MIMEQNPNRRQFADLQVMCCSAQAAAAEPVPSMAGSMTRLRCICLDFVTFPFRKRTVTKTRLRIALRLGMLMNTAFTPRSHASACSDTRRHIPVCGSSLNYRSRNLRHVNVTTHFLSVKAVGGLGVPV